MFWEGNKYKTVIICSVILLKCSKGTHKQVSWENEKEC